MSRKRERIFGLDGAGVVVVAVSAVAIISIVRCNLLLAWLDSVRRPLQISPLWHGPF